VPVVQESRQVIVIYKIIIRNPLDKWKVFCYDGIVVSVIEVRLYLTGNDGGNGREMVGNSVL